jgi:hypothetical protein
VRERAAGRERVWCGLLNCRFANAQSPGQPRWWWARHWSNPDNHQRTHLHEITHNPHGPQVLHSRLFLISHLAVASNVHKDDAATCTSALQVAG